MTDGVTHKLGDVVYHTDDPFRRPGTVVNQLNYLGERFTTIQHDTGDFTKDASHFFRHITDVPQWPCSIIDAARAVAAEWERLPPSSKRCEDLEDFCDAMTTLNRAIERNSQ